MAATDHAPADLLDDLVTFVRRYYDDELAALVEQYPRDKQSLWVDYMDLLRFDVDLADDVLTKPETVTSWLSEAIGQTELPADVDLDNVNVRLYNLPETRTHAVGDARSRTIGELIAVRGQVAKQTGVETIPVTAEFECQRCGTLATVPQDGNDLQEPHECAGCERQGPFELSYDQSTWQDIQLLRLQLPPEQTAGGNSAEIDAHVADDLVDSVEAGDRVTITGIHDVDDEGGSVGFNHFLDANSIEIEESDYQSIEIDPYLDEIRELVTGDHDPYQLLVDSIAPSVIGMDEVKEALALQLFGGAACDGPGGVSERSDIHILLLGDPGTAKSTLLEDIEAKAPCSTMASGKGATEAGMTAAAVKDDFGNGDQWSLEAGALVLADGGIACIDELDKVDESVVNSLHQALSKQIVPIDKAGINTTLPSRTSLLAAGNPKYGRFDNYEPIPEQIDLGPTLLSRFDLMFMLSDEPDEDDDRDVVEGMLQNRDEGIAVARNDKRADETDVSPAVDDDLLRAWVAHARQSVHPRWTDDEAREHLADSFLGLRLQHGGGDGEQPVPVTFRALQAQQRLAEASARVRLSETVEIEDVKRATRLYGRYMTDVGMDPESGQVDADVVETGLSKSQHDRVRNILDIVERVASEYETGAPVDVVVERAQENGISEEKARHEIDKQCGKGELYEPQPDHLRTT